MNARLQLLQSRKELLTVRAQMERLDLARHVSRLRGPAEMTYKGLRLMSLLRTPVMALVASRFAGSGGGKSSLLGQLGRMTGVAVALWKFYRGARELFAPQRSRPA
jgi:hypothetical protein